MYIIVKMQNICNFIGWNSVHISDTFNCYRANINGMWNAGKLGGIYKTFTIYNNLIQIYNTTQIQIYNNVKHTFVGIR